jgi:hypothetical protein
VENTRRKKERLLDIIDSLELKAEAGPLMVEEREALRRENEQITILRRDEETKWTQSKI